MARDRFTSALAYMPQLDSLRALSVLAVMLVHFLPEGHPLARFPFAGWGVRCFFVLSGFLITGILLESREAEEHRGRRLRDLFFFYARRSIRIFPVYYLTVAIILLLDVQHARETWPWLMTYTLNISMAMNNLLLWSVGHFWTLCVEEQFYLIWPWLILFAPTRYLVPLIMGAVALTPVFLSIAVSMGPDWYVARSTILAASTDSLGAGALLAIFSRRKYAGLGTLVRGGIWLGLPLYVLLIWMRWAEISLWGHRLFTTVALSWILFSVVYGAARGFGGWLGSIMNSPALRYIGRISYGMYIYHVFMLLFVPWIFHFMGVTMPSHTLSRFLLLGVATVGVAALSWHFFEKPINDLKRHFPAR